MECNIDDAIRAKELAEKKFLETDITGAKSFALKAQKLCPNLDGLPQLLATLEVFVSAEKGINGDVDWYQVLGVEPLADDETIRRHYRKLALTLHPDKNKSVGADEAFKLISQAWSLLSDKANRINYDRKHHFRGLCEEISNVNPSVPASQNGFFNLFNVANSKDGNTWTATQPNPAPTSPASLKQTFWTMCSFCRTGFEYHAVYLNCNLICPCCQKPFLAFEAPTPPTYNNSSSNSIISQIQQQKFKSARMERNSYVSGRTPASAMNSSDKVHGSGSFPMPGGVSSLRTSGSFAAEVPGVSGVPFKHLKRQHEDTVPSATREEAHFGKTHISKTTGVSSAFQSSSFGSNFVLKGYRPRKKQRMDEGKVDGDKRERETKMASQNKGINLAGEYGSQKGTFEIGRVNASGNNKRNGLRDVPQSQIRNMLIEKARKEIRRKLNEWSVASVSRDLDKSKNSYKEVSEKAKERTGNGAKPGVEEFQEFVDLEGLGKKIYTADSDILASEVTGSLSMSVPDPDFYDFDNNRTEKAFSKNQVWAVYDDDDGMPRYYALIHSVVSLKPFKIWISWLNSKSNDELAPIKWVSSGFPKTTGDFRIGKHVSNGSLNSFSHKVKWTKGVRGAVHIYPRKGDVWALYRNWSLDWNELTPDEIIHKYDMVEVLEDYNEKQGVNVAPLIKVAGFKTVFCQHADPRKIRCIPRAEMFRFSHQVPSYLLTGQEGHNAPRGCLELDPAATPMELLEVVKGIPKEETGIVVEKSMEDRLGHTENSKEDELVERCQTCKEEDSGEDISRKEAAEALREKESRLENLIVYKRRRVRKERAL